MRKKEIFWIVILLVLTGVYIHFYTAWFHKTGIAIHVSLRPNRRITDKTLTVFFTLNDSYRLTSIKVIPMTDKKFNPLTAPVWDLISDSNSAPVRAFRYGQGIKGMRPALKGVRPDPLLGGTTYRLLLGAGDATGTADFHTQSVSQ